MACPGGHGPHAPSGRADQPARARSPILQRMQWVYIRLGVVGLALADLLGTSAPGSVAVRWVASAAGTLALGLKFSILGLAEH